MEFEVRERAYDQAVERRKVVGQIGNIMEGINELNRDCAEMLEAEDAKVKAIDDEVIDAVDESKEGGI